MRWSEGAARARALAEPEGGDRGGRERLGADKRGDRSGPGRQVRQERRRPGADKRGDHDESLGEHVS